MEKAVLNVDIGDVLSFSQNVWSMAYDVIWLALMKLCGPRAFQSVVMATVAVIIASFYAAIIATRQAIRTRSPGDVVLMPLVDLRQIRYREIIVVSAFNLVGEPMLHGGLELLDVVE